MIDYNLKAEVLKSGYCELEKKVSRAFFKFNNYNRKGNDCNSISYNTACSIENYYIRQNNTYWQEAKKINHSSYQRAIRLKKRITAMLVFSDCIFLTLTFKDNVLNSTSDLTRKKYVSRFLKSLNCNYVANIDFGDKKGREHYHAIIEKSKIDYSSWSFGALNGEKVRSISDNNKLSKYISKLTNHAIKATTKRSCIIYSRNFFNNLKIK